jgi:antitoxin component YwqK of YwqJK toxin-antitoxin module
MKYFYLLLFCSIIHPAWGQLKKVYVDKNNNFITNPAKASSFFLIEKLDDTSDQANQYNLNNRLMVKGYYKDSSLSIPQGKFKFYFEKNKTKKNSETISNIDTNIYVQTIGYYINGKKEGKWYSYEPDGKKLSETTFIHNKENGIRKVWGNGVMGLRSEANVVNDELEGTFDEYTADSLLVKEIQYSHNKIIKTTIHLTYAVQPENYFGYLKDKLMYYENKFDLHSPPAVQFDVDTTGHVINPKIVKGVDPEVDKAIINAVLSSPLFIPARYDNKIIQQRLFYSLDIFPY